MFSNKTISFLRSWFQRWQPYSSLHKTNALNKQKRGEASLVINDLRIQPENLLHIKYEALKCSERH